MTESPPTAADIQIASNGSTQLKSTRRAERALLVNTIFRGTDVSKHIGKEAYSYYFVYRAYLPLLSRYARITEIPTPESQLDFALRKARMAGLGAIFLTFLPLHYVYVTSQGPTVAFPFWEFPDIPNEIFENNPRHNWVRIAKRLALIFTACEFTRQAFIKAGIKTPVHVLPVPVQDIYFKVLPWDRDAEVSVGCSYFVYADETVDEPLEPPEYQDQPDLRILEAPKPTAMRKIKGFGQRMFMRVRNIYKLHVKAKLPPRIVALVTRVVHGPAAAQGATAAPPGPDPTKADLKLSGVVFTSIFNPFDRRKNWTDIVSAFLLALRDRADATLVLKLVTPRENEIAAVNEVANYARQLGIRHKCKLILIPSYLSDEQIVALCRGSAYYLNASKAEGACLPLQDFLAAGRPGIAANHTAMADYFHEDVGFVVASAPEPTHWPHDPRRVVRTTWHRINWQSLHDQIKASYELLENGAEDYQKMSQRARVRMKGYASLEAVWPRLVTALDSLHLDCDAKPENELQPEVNGVPVEVR